MVIGGRLSHHGDGLSVAEVEIGSDKKDKKGSRSAEKERSAAMAKEERRTRNYESATETLVGSETEHL